VVRSVKWFRRGEGSNFRLPIDFRRRSLYTTLPPHYTIIIIICYVVFIAFNINHSSILPLMALNNLYCADVPLNNYSVTPALQCECIVAIVVVLWEICNTFVVACSERSSAKDSDSEQYVGDVRCFACRRRQLEFSCVYRWIHYRLVVVCRSRYADRRGSRLRYQRPRHSQWSVISTGCLKVKCPTLFLQCLWFPILITFSPPESEMMNAHIHMVFT